MSDEVFTVYLNDHLAGSVAAIELVDHLRQASKATEREQLLAGLRVDIEADQTVLRELLERAGGTESKVRKAAAWLTEKLGEAKLKLDHPGSDDLGWLEALETLSLGILGKQALWGSLEAARDRRPELQALDLKKLKSRAVEQHQRVEAERLQVARRALVG
jgi:hypothetical protein